MKTKLIQVLVTEEIAASLAEAAKNDRRSLSAYCGVLLTEHLKNNKDYLEYCKLLGEIGLRLISPTMTDRDYEEFAKLKARQQKLPWEK